MTGAWAARCASLERVRLVVDAYLIGVERGRAFEQEYPHEHHVDAPRMFRCGCYLCRAEDVGFDVGASSERGAS